MPHSDAGPHRLRPQDRARWKRAYSRQSSRSDAFEVMQGNFGKTIKADRNGSASHSNRGVANHIAILPWPRAHMPRQNRTKRDRNRTGQANLTAVGMATEKDIEASMCGLAVNFGRMRQQDGESVARNFGCRFLDVIDPIIMRIVDAGEVDRVISARNDLSFVEQYSDSHVFKFGNHEN